MTDMTLAYRLASHAVRRRFAEQHPARLAALHAVRASDVAVYSGTYDHVHEVLKLLGVPYTLNPSPEKLADARVVFVNCASNYPAGRATALAAAVARGATLVTSDWALGHLVQGAFPNTVRWTGKATADEVVGVEPAADSLWSEVVVLGVDPQWWLESSSHPIEVLDPSRVKVEAASHEMLSRHGAAAVAVRFPWERGEVFHVASHFWLKRSRADSARHKGAAADFLREGMRLSPDGIETVTAAAGAKPSAVNFASIQSAATATELVARLCLPRDVAAQPPPPS